MAKTPWSRAPHRAFGRSAVGPDADGSSVSPFIERSRAAYVRTHLWMNGIGAVVITTISLLQGWRVGLLLAVMNGTLAAHAFFRRELAPVETVAWWTTSL